MRPEGQRGLPQRLPNGAPDTPSTTKSGGTLRAVVVEPYLTVRVVLEYLLAREGYAVEAGEEPFSVAPGRALLLVSATDGSGLYAFVSENAADTLAGLISGTGRSFQTLSGTRGIEAFLPKPFGMEDVLRVVQVVDGFDGRRTHRGHD